MALSLPIDPSASAAIKYSLLASLMRRVQAVLEPTVDKSFGLRAELSAADERGGVFYGELTESDARGKVIAKMRCMIWSQDLRRIRMRFAREGLELTLQRGTVIGVQCVLQFHPVHGMSVRVIDMDPAFVVGELELRRRRTLASLERDGLLGRNATLPVPLVPNRIVLITSSQGAAYHDFMRTLHERRFGIRVWLADATMQGPETEASVLRALNAAEKLAPDLVIVIRGGGSKTDLSWLDSEAIARRIASFGRPVWTGIGHETDRSVLDAVAGQSFRTPTAVAEALTARIERVGNQLDESGTRLREAFARAHRTERDALRQQALRITQAPRQRLSESKLKLEASRHQLQRTSQARIASARTRWTVCKHALQQANQKRTGALQRALHALQSEWSASVRRTVERRRAALDTRAQRFEPRPVIARLAAERLRISHVQTALVKGSGAHVAKERAALGVARTALHTRLEAQLARARLALAPHTHLLRRALEGRLRAALSRVSGAHAELRRASLRALERRQDAFAQVRRRLTPDRALPLIERERRALAQRALVVRAHDPRSVLARGFTLTYDASGHIVRSARALVPSDVVTTQFVDGRAVATVRDIQQEPEHE